MLRNVLKVFPNGCVMRFVSKTWCIVVCAFLCSSSQALAVGSPPETPITERCAGLVIKPGEALELCGTLNPHSSRQVGAYFAINEGPSCTGDDEIPAEAATDEGEDIKVTSRQLIGLEPGSEYTYCVVATNQSGDTFGQPLTFMTPAEPKTEPATAVTSTAAILEGTLEPNDTKLKYKFEDHQGASCHGSATTPEAEGENKVSAKIEGLSPNTEYSFCLVIASSEGGSVVGQPEHFRTPESQAEKEANAKFEQEVTAKAEAQAKAELEAKDKGEAEAAAAKEKHEEAAIRLQEEELAQKRREAESASKSLLLAIIKVQVSASSLTVTLTASTKGTVTITGLGLERTVRGVTAGSNRVKVPLTKIGRSNRKHHEKAKFWVTLRTADKTALVSRLVRF